MKSDLFVWFLAFFFMCVVFNTLIAILSVDPVETTELQELYGSVQKAGKRSRHCNFMLSDLTERKMETKLPKSTRGERKYYINRDHFNIMKEKKKYLEGTAQVLRESQEQKKKYKINILGKEFVVYPNVFSPKYFHDPKFFAEELPINKGDKFLEIGCGTGVISIFAALKGASNVVAIDINPAAVKNTKENVKLHKLESKIRILRGDVFEPLRSEQFDVIFWNVPFGLIKREYESMTERSVFDPEYKYIKKFINEARKHLKPNGRLLIGFSSTMGHLGILKQTLKAAGYKTKLVAKTISTEIHPVKFEIFEAKLG